MKTRADVSDPLVGAVLGDRYRVLERIAAGGMGQVYRAAHARIACLFAVKVLYGDLAYEPSMQTRFLREAEIASCFSSRYITRVVDFGQSERGLPYLAMEYLDGSTLFDIVARDGALSPRRAATLAQRISLGLAHAHERGIVHRDLKTENVIVIREDEEPDIPKLLDFGVARLKESDRLTTAGFVVGTPLYMAPEQFGSEDVDARADLYALGVILYEMLTGVPPFDSTSIPELADKHRNQPPPSVLPLLAASGMSGELDEVLQRLLAKRPADRFASARDVAHALAAIGRAGRADAPPVSRTATAPRSVVEPAIHARIERAILEGAPAYNVGDHERCFHVYRDTARGVLADGPASLAGRVRLEVGLARAEASPTPTAAAWEMRHAFDDLLFAGSVRVEASMDTCAREHAAFVAIASRRDVASSPGIVADYAVGFARALARLLTERGERPELARSLEETADRGARMGSPQAALATLTPLLDTLTPRGVGGAPVGATLESSMPASLSAAGSAQPSLPPVSSAPPSGLRTSAMPPSGANDEIVDAISRAILVGAPAYNQGRYEVCQRVYRDTARSLGDQARRDPAGGPFAAWISDVIARSDARPAREAAWVLRHAFDAILASRTSPG